MARRKNTSDTAIETEPVETAASPEIIVKEDEEVVNGEVVGGDTEASDGTDSCGDTVCVCSNFPFDIKYMVPDANGRPRPIVFNGNATGLKGKEKGILPVGAYGITTGVPKEAWEWILKHRPDEPAIRNGNLFATTASKARSAARERKDIRHGFEPVSTKKGK